MVTDIESFLVKDVIRRWGERSGCHADHLALTCFYVGGNRAPIIVSVPAGRGAVGGAAPGDHNWIVRPILLPNHPVTVIGVPVTNHNQHQVIHMSNPPVTIAHNDLMRTVLQQNRLPGTPATIVPATFVPTHRATTITNRVVEGGLLCVPQSISITSRGALVGHQQCASTVEREGIWGTRVLEWPWKPTIQTVSCAVEHLNLITPYHLCMTCRFWLRLCRAKLYLCAWLHSYMYYSHLELVYLML